MSYPNIDMLFLNEEDMIKAGVGDVVRCTDCMEELLKILDMGDYRMGGDNGNSHGCMVTFPEKPEFPNMPANGPDRRFMAMPAYVGGRFDMAGMKWYGSNVANRDKGLPRSILMMMLNDKETGAPLALMSANLLSAYRTAGIPGVGVKNLAPKDAKVLGIVGPGVINTITVETFAALRPSLLYVYLLRAEDKHPLIAVLNMSRKSVRSSRTSLFAIPLKNVYEIVIS